eukprot:Amastigsp_a339527_9.p2 type:complete len:182 gc:universal Amastigsp_a339527_9:720-1265(+)
MPRVCEKNCWSVILSRTWSECASVLSMMSANESTYAVSAWRKTPGLCAWYCRANDSMMRSIFCASPGSLKVARNARSAVSRRALRKSNDWTKQSRTARGRSASSPRYSPIFDLYSPGVSRKNAAIACAFSAASPSSMMYRMPSRTDLLNRLTAIFIFFSRCVRASSSGSVRSAASSAMYST